MTQSKTKKTMPAKRTKATERATPRTRKSSKSASVLQLLKSKDGASLEELMTATGWQAHSVRGFLSGTAAKKLGLALTSSRGGDGVRRYRIDG